MEFACPVLFAKVWGGAGLFIKDGMEGRQLSMEFACLGLLLRSGVVFLFLTSN